MIGVKKFCESCQRWLEHEEEIMVKPLNHNELERIRTNLNRREMIPFNAYHRLIATIDAYEQLVKQKDEALEILSYERGTLDAEELV